MNPTNPQIANIIGQFKQSNPSYVAPTSSQNDWYTSVKSGAYAPKTNTTQPAEGNFGQRVSSDISTAGQNVESAIAGEGQYAGQSSVRRGVEATASAFNTIPQVASEVLPKPARDVVGAVGQGASNIINWLGDKLGSTQVAQDFVQQHPDAAKFLEEATGTLSAGGQIAGDILTADQVAKAGNKGVEATGKGIDAVQNKLSSMAETSAEKAQTGAEKAAGQITQGKISQAKTSAKVLANPALDTTGVKTYNDLSDSLQAHINNLKAAVDTEYEKNPMPIKLEDLSQNLKSGETTAQANYVKDALGQLKELYTKTNDPLSAAKIEDLTTKAINEGLTPKEINDLSRQYGNEFGDKAFSKTGDPLTSVNAQNFENTRSGIKDTARNLLQDDTAKSLDKNMSDAIQTKQLVDKVAEKVNALTERVKERGVIEKFGRLLGKGVDMATFGGPRAFIMKWLFPSNIGLKTLNSLDLQDLLSKNLEKVQQLEAAPESTLPGKLLQFIKEDKPEASIPKQGSIEQMAESAGGWQPGDKALFDKAILHGDAATIKEMLPRVPKEYQQSFANKIQGILQGSQKTESAPESLLSSAKNNITGPNSQRGFLSFGKPKLSPARIASIKAEIQATQKLINDATRAKAPPARIKGYMTKLHGLQRLLR